MGANFDLPLTARLKEELERRDVSVIDFERATGIDKGKVYKWLKRGTVKIDPKEAKIIEAWISGQLDNVPHETKKGQQGNMDIIKSLLEQNNKMTDAILADARSRESDSRSRETISESNKELVQMLKEKVTEGAGQQNQSDAVAIRSVILELLLEYGSGVTHWQTVEEGRAIYRKRIADALDLTKREGIQNNSGKQRI